MRLEMLRVHQRVRVQVPVAGMVGYGPLKRCKERTVLPLDLAVFWGRYDVVKVLSIDMILQTSLKSFDVKQLTLPLCVPLENHR